MIRDVVPVHKHYLVIDSPIPFILIANDGTDEVYRPAGAWQIDLWSILTKEYFKQYPVFKLEIEYDETKLDEGQTLVYRQSDINLGTGLSGVNGQAIQIIGDSVGLATKEKQDTIITAIQSIDFSSISQESTLQDIKTLIDSFFKKKIVEYTSQEDIVNALTMGQEVPRGGVSVLNPDVLLIHDNLTHYIINNKIKFINLSLIFFIFLFFFV